MFSLHIYFSPRDSSVPISSISWYVKACRVLIMTVVVFVSANCNSYKSQRHPILQIGLVHLDTGV